MSHGQFEVVSEAIIADGLRDLTRLLMERGYPTSGGLLGGEYGYGAYFENDVFMMHPYCWCEQEGCPWCNVCLCPEGAFSYFVGEEEVDFAEWLAASADSRSTREDPDLLCERCREGREEFPNFLHKESGTTVRWYKYIGRGMEVELRGDWQAIASQCAEAIAAAPSLTAAPSVESQLLNWLPGTPNPPEATFLKGPGNVEN